MSSEENIPAWKKKINLKQIKESNTNSVPNDSLKVVKHLSSDTILSKKDKKSIISQQNKVSKKSKDKIRSKAKMNDKLEKQVHLTTTFLRDQLKYLIEYYIYKYSVEELPEDVKSQENVQKNMDLNDSAIKSWKFNKNKQIWLLKNCFVKEDVHSEGLIIPQVYDAILVEYFINLPKESKIKKDLVEKSWEILKSWNEGVRKQKAYMVKMLNEEGEEKENKGDDEEKEAKDDQKVILPHKDIVSRAHKIVLNLDKVASNSFNLEQV